MTSPAALHSSGSSEHFTPGEVTAAACTTMGRIDLDPFSCPAANKVVRASMIYTPQDDGFSLPWGDEADPQAVFCNPPSHKVKRKPERAPKDLSKPAQIHAWWMLLDEYEAGRVEQAIFLCFNMSLFQTAQRFRYAAPFEFPFCAPRKRLQFWGADLAPGKGSPPHASAIVFLPPRIASPVSQAWKPYALEAFATAFSPLGAVRL